MDWKQVQLSPQERDAVNTLCRWLGEGDSAVGQAFDAIIIAGNSAIPTLEAGFTAASESGKPLWLVGGIGHATHYLVEAVAVHPRYQHLAVAGLSEARIMQAMAGCWNIPDTQCWLEPDSRNSGENAAFTLACMQQQQSLPQQALLLQDPLLQRRTGATFDHVWQQAGLRCHFINYPGWALTIEAASEGVTTHGRTPPWDAARFFDLMMGEIPRLRNDPAGYGPRGKGFIGAVAIPDSVEAAWQLLHQRKLGASRLSQ